MSTPCLNIAMLGLSITSSWGHGHATTYRGLVRALVERGHTVLFLERDVPCYAAPRDVPAPPYGHTELYTGLEDLQDCFMKLVICRRELPGGSRAVYPVYRKASL